MNHRSECSREIARIADVPVAVACDCRPHRTVLIYSGGMDSTVLLYHLRALGHEVHPLAIDYGQRHRRELESARAICADLGLSLHVADISPLRELFSGSSQTDPLVDVPDGHYAEPTMRATVVPNRNMIMLAVAGARAAALGCTGVAYGAHAGDHAIYPDCRYPFVSAMRDAFAVCHYDRLWLMAPFLNMDKGEIARRGAELGVPFDRTWTCYRGGERHCGRCGACVERREALALIGDPTEYECSPSISAPTSRAG